MRLGAKAAGILPSPVCILQGVHEILRSQVEVIPQNLDDKLRRRRVALFRFDEAASIRLTRVL